MDEPIEEPLYLSYLLRLWPAQVAGRTVWRASLESCQTGSRAGFIDLEALFAFLEQTTQNVLEHALQGDEENG
jgi:hypothetical protein